MNVAHKKLLLVFISFRSLIRIGYHAYPLTTLGYFVPDGLSEEITRYEVENLCKSSHGLACTDEAKSCPCTFCPCSLVSLNSSIFLLLPFVKSESLTSVLF